MQISDLLGKYGQNTVPVTAQEQAVKTGTQQLAGTLSSLQTGNVFEGTVTDISDGQVLLTLANGEKISARLEGQIQLRLNQAMFFEVKSNTQTQIAIKPYLNGDSSNPTLLKALMQAGMGVTTDNLEMVRTMMEEQLPIDKNSLNQMMRQLAMFPKAAPSVIAQMNKLGIPVTEANVQQFSNYKADTAAIMKELENVLEQLPKSIAGEGDTAGQMTAKNMQLMDILFGGETIEQSQDAGAKAQELLAKTADGSVTIKSGEQQAADIAKELQQILSTAEDGMQQTSAAGEGIQQADAAKQAEGRQMPAATQGSLGEILGKEGAASLEQQLKALETDGKQVLFDKNGNLNTGMSAEEFLKNLNQLFKENEFPQKEALFKLFSGKEYQTIFKKAVENQWYLEPQETGSKETVEKLYNRLQTQMNRLDEFIKQAGSGTEGLQKAVADVRGNIEFMNQINQIYNFVQLPLKMNGQNVNSELYVYTNKKNPRDMDGELSAFLHLDMDHLGSTDISVKMKGTAVKTNFYMADDASYELILAHAEELAERLENKGYQCQIEVKSEEKDMDFVEDFLKHDMPSAGKVYRYSFDVRA
ncbi:flagellar hook-length control protein FliK [Lachnospiraceae bacterium CLA-AA-H185]|uniref:Flagellar hook-length control protein FliK n=1 Tax=Maccoyibacter intestinihominis TaxID=3133499 RepID=A0ABV1HA11_9FIRM